MQLKRKKVNMGDEQQIAINMIVSTKFIQNTKDILKGYLLKSAYARYVTEWCQEYYEHFKKAPEKDIQELYKRKKKSMRAEEEEEFGLVSEFLSVLSRQWEETNIHNVDYEIKKANEYVRIRKLELLKEQLEEALLEGDFIQGENALVGFKKVREAESTSVDVLKDTAKVKQAFSQEDEILFYMPGDLGIAMGPFIRGDFVLLLGGPKSGKSFSLLAIAHRAALSGLRVLIVNMEITEVQYTRRVWQTLTGLPRESTKVVYPRFIEDEDEEGKFRIDYETIPKPGVMSMSIEERQAFYRKNFRGGEIKVENFVEGTSSFSDVVARMDNLKEYEDFEPDVIIWDYPDIMRHEIKADLRHQIDDTYIKIRGLSQSRNILSVAVSQVEAGAWYKDIKGKNANENKKKAAHIGKMFAINATPHEMEAGYVRVQSLYDRDHKRSNQQVVVLQNLEVSRWYLNSKFVSKVIFDD
jgi:DNA replication protein DnaC